MLPFDVTEMLYLLVIQCSICFNFIGATDKRVINGNPVIDFGTLLFIIQ